MATAAFPGLAVPGSTYPNQLSVGLKKFRPPTVLRRLDTKHRLFSRVSLPTGQTVLKDHLGSYVTVENPTPEQIDAAAIAYLGGHVYDVDALEAAALTAAGYEVTDD